MALKEWLAPRRRSPVGSRAARNELQALSQSSSRVDDIVLVLRFVSNPRADVIISSSIHPTLASLATQDSYHSSTPRHRYTIPLTRASCAFLPRPLQYDPIFSEAQMPLQGVANHRPSQGPHLYPSDRFWKEPGFQESISHEKPQHLPRT